jgi:hypothetical protein
VFTPIHTGARPRVLDPYTLIRPTPNTPATHRIHAQVLLHAEHARHAPTMRLAHTLNTLDTRLTPVRCQTPALGCMYDTLTMRPPRTQRPPYAKRLPWARHTATWVVESKAGWVEEGGGGGRHDNVPVSLVPQWRKYACDFAHPLNHI